MGSDLYMAEQNYRPRPNRVTWDGPDKITIEQDRFYHGYTTIYAGKFTDEIKAVIKGMGIKLPLRPGDLATYCMDFNYMKAGLVHLQLSKTHFDTDKKIKERLMQAAMDEYNLSLADIRGVKVTEVSE